MPTSSYFSSNRSSITWPSTCEPIQRTTKRLVAVPRETGVTFPIVNHRRLRKNQRVRITCGETAPVRRTHCEPLLRPLIAMSRKCCAHACCDNARTNTSFCSWKPDKQPPRVCGNFTDAPSCLLSTVGRQYSRCPKISIPKNREKPTKSRLPGGDLNGGRTMKGLRHVTGR